MSIELLFTLAIIFLKLNAVAIVILGIDKYLDTRDSDRLYRVAKIALCLYALSFCLDLFYRIGNVIFPG